MTEAETQTQTQIQNLIEQAARRVWDLIGDDETFQELSDKYAENHFQEDWPEIQELLEDEDREDDEQVLEYFKVVSEFMYLTTRKLIKDLEAAGVDPANCE